MTDTTTLVQLVQRIRAGWLPHRVGGQDGRWWWGRPRYDDGFRLWSEGHVPSMAAVEPMTDEEIRVWAQALHPLAPERDKHTDVHDCDHDDCDCFWCRVSRREPFPTGIDTMELSRDDRKQV